MKKDFMNMVLKSVKNLLGNKSTQTILRYIASVTIDFACKKFNIPIYIIMVRKHRLCRFLKKRAVF